MVCESRMANTEARVVASEARAVAAEERAVASEARAVAAEERAVASEARAVAAEERAMPLAEAPAARAISTDETTALQTSIEALIAKVKYGYPPLSRQLPSRSDARTPRHATSQPAPLTQRQIPTPIVSHSPAQLADSERLAPPTPPGPGLMGAAPPTPPGTPPPSGVTPPTPPGTPPGGTVAVPSLFIPDGDAIPRPSLERRNSNPFDDGNEPTDPLFSTAKVPLFSQEQGLVTGDDPFEAVSPRSSGSTTGISVQGTVVDNDPFEAVSPRPSASAAGASTPALVPDDDPFEAVSPRPSASAAAAIAAEMVDADDDAAADEDPMAVAAAIAADATAAAAAARGAGETPPVKDSAAEGTEEWV